MAYLSRAKLKFEAFCYFITYTNVDAYCLSVYHILLT